MANIKLNYGGSIETCWSDTSKITTPSLILNDNGTLRYTPLFSGNAGQQIVHGSYKYTLGHLKVGDYRAAINRVNNTWTNTVVIGYYTAVSRHQLVIMGNREDLYIRYFYIRVVSASMQKGSIDGMDVNDGGCYHESNSSWVEAYSDRRTSQVPPTTATIYVKINGTVYSRNVDFSTSEQQTTFTQTGT